MKGTVAILILGAVVARAGISGAPFKVELRKAEDSAAMTSTQDFTVVTITSRSGIGGAKLVRAGTGWPARLTIRLTVKGLESLRMENGVIHFEASLGSPKKVPYRKVGKNDRQADSPDGTIEVIALKTEEAVEIIVPGELMDGNPERISLEWIDFYR